MNIEELSKKSLEAIKDVSLNDKMFIWCEEASELIKAITKWARNKDLSDEIRKNIIDSIVDMIIVIQDIEVQIDLKLDEYAKMYKEKTAKNKKTFKEVKDE